MSPPPSTWPTTPSTASATIVLCVMGRSLPHRYIAGAGVAKLVRRARLKIGWPPGYAGSSPAPGIREGVESLLQFAEELERRDAELGGALDARRASSSTRSRSSACTRSRLPGSSRPSRRRSARSSARSARSIAARDAAERALREAEGREDEQVLVPARDALREAERWAADAALACRRLEEDRAARRSESDRFLAQAQALSPRVHDVPAPAGGLDGALEWASRARGALLLEHSGLARERDAVVREASELLGSVLGEPLISTAVAGVRGKLERALQGGAP